MQVSIATPLDNALAQALRTGALVRRAFLLPVPLIAIALILLQTFAPGHAATVGQPAVLPWYKDLFLIGIFVVYVFAQLVVVAQLKTIARGLSKVKAVVIMLATAGPRAPVQELQARLASLNAPGHLTDLVARWLQMGLKGEIDTVKALMEQASHKRQKSVDRKLSIHNNINRTMMKLGFLGTLIGLMMTFPPMKDAILTLDPKNIEKGASYIQLIAGAIDGDQYAILTTLLATGFSIFIELLTIQTLKSICGRFEMVNAYVDEWSTAELQPWMRENYAPKNDANSALAQQKAFQEKLLEIEGQFQVKMGELHQASQRFIAGLLQNSQESWARVHEESEVFFNHAREESENRMRGMQEESSRRLGGLIQHSAGQLEEIQNNVNKNVDLLGKMVKVVAERMGEFVPLQQSYGRRMDELLAYERQYRSFLEVQSQVSIPRHLKPEANHNRENN